MLSRRVLANAIRALSMDAVQKANSGHPGMPMGMADIAEVLWMDFLKHNPQNPQWPNRDRFILSNGHGSMLQYALLHLTGYDLSIEDIKQFRQLHSKTPGHPEKSATPGVETTTGPLGQGLANAVGMTLAEHLLAAEFNQENYPIIDHFTYCFVGDGCLMEGISHEVSSFAGTFGLGKLIVFWDNNSISIDGNVKGWFLDNTPARFEAYGWHVQSIDGHDADAVKNAIMEAQQCLNKPSIICCKTTIGFGAPDAGTEKVHGQALGEKGVEAARQKLDWKYGPFEIPQDIYDAYNAKVKGQQEEQKWQTLFDAYCRDYPDLSKELNRRLHSELPEHWQEKMTDFVNKTQESGENIATRKASQNALNFITPLLPELLGGSADLSESNLTESEYSKTIYPHKIQGNYIHYGVREFGMSAMMNGIAVYKGFIPYGGTFLTFLDYARNAVRMAALMKQRVIFVYTHDSVGLGEDGPTHQPIEHLAILRATPNMSLWRPCDATETAVAWQMAILRTTGPTSLALTRQKVPHQFRTKAQIALIARGGYILRDCEGIPDIILIATGSEVQLVIESAKILTETGVKIRVVSMPSTDIFEAQDRDYQESVLPTAVKARVAVEAAVCIDWYKWVGSLGAVLGIDSYGESAPYEKVLVDLGMTAEAVVALARKVLRNNGA